MPEQAAEPWVGLVSIGLCLAGLATFLTVGCVINLCIVPHLPLKRCPNPWLRWGGLVAAAPLTLAAMFLTVHLLSAAAIVQTYGWEGYAAGLEVENKFGLVSNGEYLDTFWSAAIGGLILPCWLLCLTPALIWNEIFRELGASEPKPAPPPERIRLTGVSSGDPPNARETAVPLPKTGGSGDKGRFEFSFRSPRIVESRGPWKPASSDCPTWARARSSTR